MSRQTPQATKLYREKNLEKQRAYIKEYGQRPETIALRRAYRLRNPEMQLIINARSRARIREIEFDLQQSDIVIPELCPILGIPLIISTGKASDNSPTLDRVDPTKGYVKDNVRVISHRANSKKQDNTIEDFERFIRYMKGQL